MLAFVFLLTSVYSQQYYSLCNCDYFSSDGGITFPIDECFDSPEHTPSYSSRYHCELNQTTGLYTVIEQQWWDTDLPCANDSDDSYTYYEVIHDKYIEWSYVYYLCGTKNTCDFYWHDKYSVGSSDCSTFDVSSNNYIRHQPRVYGCCAEYYGNQSKATVCDNDGNYVDIWWAPWSGNTDEPCTGPQDWNQTWYIYFSN